ncbi:hypothetical protein ACSBR1_031685 [Camellia fascicularis]
MAHQNKSTSHVNKGVCVNNRNNNVMESVKQSNTVMAAMAMVVETLKSSTGNARSYATSYHTANG